MPASLFEDGPYRGRLVPVEPRMLAFDEETRGRVSGWLGTGVVDPAKEPRGAVLGMSLVPVEGAGAPTWTLAMDPIAALGREARVVQFGTWDSKGREVTAAPDRWTRRMLDDLIALVGREAMIERLGRAERLALEGRPRTEVTEELRDAVWAELVPTRYRVRARAVDPVRAHEVTELMGAEGISAYQVELVQRVERRHPTRPDGTPVAPHLDQSEEDAFRSSVTGACSTRRARSRGPSATASSGRTSSTGRTPRSLSPRTATRSSPTAAPGAGSNCSARRSSRTAPGRPSSTAWRAASTSDAPATSPGTVGGPGGRASPTTTGATAMARTFRASRSPWTRSSRRSCTPSSAS